MFSRFLSKPAHTCISAHRSVKQTQKVECLQDQIEAQVLQSAAVQVQPQWEQGVPAVTLHPLARWAGQRPPSPAY